MYTDLSKSTKSNLSNSTKRRLDLKAIYFSIHSIHSNKDIHLQIEYIMGLSQSSSQSKSTAAAKAVPPPSTRLQVTAMLKRAYQQFPSNIATIDFVSGRQRTYKECVERVAKLAGALQGNGLSRSDVNGGRIALVMLNSDRYFESFFACSWAGGMVVPMNIRLAPLEMLEQFNDCQVEFIIVDDAFKNIIPQIQGKVPSLKKFIYAGESAEAPSGCLHYETLISTSHPVADGLRGGDDTFGLYYTGGTTGKSKGVELTHGNIVVNALVSFFYSFGFVDPFFDLEYDTHLSTQKQNQNDDSLKKVGFRDMLQCFTILSTADTYTVLQCSILQMVQVPLVLH